MISEKVVASGSGFAVVARVIGDKPVMDWYLYDEVGADVVDATYSHVDAASWLVRICPMDWDYAEAKVDEAIAWANRVIRDQDIVLHRAPGLCSDTGACGQ